MPEKNKDSTARTFTWVGLLWLALPAYAYITDVGKFTFVERSIFMSAFGMVMGMFCLLSAELYKLKTKIRELEKRCNSIGK